ncbi:MAG: beta-lactamase family protein [Bacteroidales bacterium]|nr:beta-lactamase family protein [Bacteroidales bacterium]MBN2698315.1 beta-lactamase family protein [Bacteroidales bacterium]
MRRIWNALIVATGIMVSAILVVVVNSGANEPVQNHAEEIVSSIPLTREDTLFQSCAEHIQHAFDSLKTVGAAFTIVHKGKVVLTRTMGCRSLDSEEPVDEHTVFRLASVSKGFAGILAAILEEKGYLSLDDRVAEHYPGFRLKDPVSTAEMTINHILSHTTGLVPHAFDNLVEAGIDLEDIIDQLPEVEISGPPGYYYGYQNVLFSIIDLISERVTGKAYPDLLEQEIFLPLGMRDASVGKLDTAINRNIAYPHLKDRKGYFQASLHEGYYNVLPAAGVNASISDLGIWLKALLGSTSGVISGAVLEKISTPVIYTPLKWQYTKHWDPFRERYYSLGWRIYDYRGRRIIYHGGYVRGYRAEIAFCPEEQVGIAFLQNSPNGMASTVVPEFLNRFFEIRQESSSTDTISRND